MVQMGVLINVLVLRMRHYHTLVSNAYILAVNIMCNDTVLYVHTQMQCDKAGHSLSIQGAEHAFYECFDL